jgi:hypothetical protein
MGRACWCCSLLIHLEESTADRSTYSAVISMARPLLKRCLALQFCGNFLHTHRIGSLQAVLKRRILSPADAPIMDDGFERCPRHCPRHIRRIIGPCHQGWQTVYLDL